MLHTLMNEAKAVVVDIGGFTADYLLMKNGKADLSSCDSLENGVILLYNKIRSRGNAELDLLLDEGDVDAILTGKQTQYPPSVVRLVEQLAQEVRQRPVQHPAGADAGFALLHGSLCGRRRHPAASAD